jgi:acyl-CoA dehydrogenase
MIMTPGAARERLCAPVYNTLAPHNPLGLLQEALELAEAAEALEKRIRVEGVKSGKVTALDLPGRIRQAQQQGIVTAAEADSLARFDAKVMDLLNVDDFAPQEIGNQGTAP